MRTIFAEYNPHRNSIDIYTSAGYMLRIDCWEAEKDLKTTPGSDCALNALAIDKPLEYAKLYLDETMQISANSFQKIKPCFLIHHKEIFIIPAPRTTHKNLKSLILCISCRFQNLDIVKSCYQFVSSNSFFLTMQFHKTQWNPQDIFYDYEHVYTFDSNLTPVNQCCQIFFLTSYPPVSIGGF